MGFKRFVNIIEIVVAVVALGFVVLLFANQPDDGGATADASPGAAIFSANCASCHGSSGGGGIGPALADGKVVDAYPDAADEIAVVTDGQSGMPGFGDSLSAEEIEQVVEYTRTDLG